MKQILLFPLISALFINGALMSAALGGIDADAEAVLDRMASARHPDGLSGFTCHAEMETTVEGGELSELAMLSILELPTIGMDITYIAPFDFRVEIENSPIPATDSLQSVRLRGDDPLTLSNPALKQALLAIYDVEYKGKVQHDGEQCHVLHFLPKEETATRPAFDLYIRESDDLPVYTEMTLSTGSEEIEFRSEIEYADVDGFLLPGRVETRADFISGAELVMTTVFSEYEVNAVTLLDSGGKGSDDDNDDDEYAFSDIYRGFEDPVMMVELSEDSAPYRMLRFAFALEVPSDEVAGELDAQHPGIVEAVRGALSGRSWSSLKERRYEVGREMMDIINGILTDGGVTDFYFTIYQAER